MCQSKTRPKCTIVSQKYKKILHVSLTKKCWVSPWGRKKDLADGPQSHYKHGTGVPGAGFRAEPLIGGGGHVYC